jgi:hypothetical protein
MSANGLLGSYLSASVIAQNVIVTTDALGPVVVQQDAAATIDPWFKLASVFTVLQVGSMGSFTSTNVVPVTADACDAGLQSLAWQFCVGTQLNCQESGISHGAVTSIPPLYEGLPLAPYLGLVTPTKVVGHVSGVGLATTGGAGHNSYLSIDDTRRIIHMVGDGTAGRIITTMDGASGIYRVTGDDLAPLLQCNVIGGTVVFWINALGGRTLVADVANSAGAGKRRLIVAN